MTGSRTVSLICKGPRANLPPGCRDPRFGIWGHGATAFPLCQLRHTGEVARLAQRHVGPSGGRAKNWMSRPSLSFQVLATLTLPF